MSQRARATRRAPFGPILGVVLAASAAVVTIGAAPAHATPDAAVQEQAELPTYARLDRLVARNHKALEAIRRQADRRSREIAGQKVLLAQYGYVGDPDKVEAVLPLADYDLSAGFGLTGPLWEAEHGGQDFSAPSGTTLVAVSVGVVTDVGDAGPYGLRTVLTLPDGTEVWYCHQSAVMVSVGDHIDVASPIGLVGSTGNTTGPHLHLEVRPDGGSPIDPTQWLVEAGLTP